MCNPNEIIARPDEQMESEGSDNGEHSVSSLSSTSDSSSDSSSDDDEDEVVKAIARSREKLRDKPPEVTSEDLIVDISFHPTKEYIAGATITGDVLLYNYTRENIELVQTFEIHTKSCRVVKFSENGTLLITGSKDKSIMITDFETAKLKTFFDDAHEAPLYSLLELKEHLIVSGDENGTVKLWDTRQKKQVFALKEMDDYVSSILTNGDERFIICSSGEGTVTSFDLRNNRMHIQSEVYEAELTCAELVRKDTKLVAGSSQGSLVFYNWGQFGLHTDEFPATKKKSLNCMIRVSENIIVTGWEDGSVRATYLFPHRNLGIVGQHSLSVESIDISGDGEFIATCSFDQKLKFWPIRFFEDINSVASVDKKNDNHNLPSSNFSNRADFFADLV